MLMRKQGDQCAFIGLKCSIDIDKILKRNQIDIEIAILIIGLIEYLSELIILVSTLLHYNHWN
jgi:hypothetical protein